ncbi:exodeoxyribonuclease V subunit gamma [Jannaschia sp. R86511]|uniref:exodeoxyribonuclease V subunit gamma n=1 Tax=Jannaschia sp. R86511 TaxID=3093853 RepID=UPI0036D2CFFE
MLTVHRAEQATVLADGLADMLARPLPDPFVAEVVAVPARGVERWLAQRLSHRLGADGSEADAGAGGRPAGAPGPDGVCANVRFPTPHRLLADATAVVAPAETAALEAWTPERLTWPVLEVVDDVVGEDWCRVLRRHLYAGGVPAREHATGRRLSLARTVARLFHSYARNRPDLLRAWAGEHPVLPDGRPLGEYEQWQMLLWNQVRHRLGGTSPVDLQAQVLDRVRADPDRLDAPERLSLFGLSRVARADLDLLGALAEHRDVHLWLHHASPALWRAVAAAGPVRRRADDQVGARLANPLLRSLSRDVRELQHLLRAHVPDHVDVHHPRSGPTDGPGATAGAAAPDRPVTLLARLVDDLARDHVPADPPPLRPGDRSVQVHACHGRTRQVEVLREVVLGLLADDPTLEPRDVLVMCPDVETFAPLLAAAFTTTDHEVAGHGAHPASRLRVRVADRALHQANPLLAVLDRLLDLGSARLGATEVLDLAGHPAVARRFGLDDDALERLRDWVRDSGTRWGLHETHRRAWQLQAVPDGTWRRGVDRLLLGATVDPGHGAGAATVAGLVPLDDVDSSDIDLAGRFAELLDRLDRAHGDLAVPHDAPGWARLLEQAVLDLAAPEAGAAWQAVQLREVLEEALLATDAEGSAAPAPATAPTTVTAAAPAAAPASAELTLTELRPVLRTALAGRPTRAGFRTGALTVCTLVPMRSVPHRVVVLLGLDDGAFPRQTVRDGDDLLARDPEVGDRDPRSEDRQLLLDAVCAAGEHLVLLHTGADERTGAPVPPAVPLGELLDALDRTCVVPSGGRVRDAVTTHHPLQPFDARNFTAGALGRPGPFSFDPRAHAGARAALGPRRAPAELLPAPLPPVPTEDVAVTDLVRLLVQPAKGFLRQRLQISLGARDDDPADALPVGLDPLEQWQVGDRMLRDRLAGLDQHRCAVLERGRGLLPPGPLGDAVLRSIGPRVDALAAAAAGLLGPDPDAVDVEVDLGDGTVLSGTVGGLRGDRLVAVHYSSLAPKHRLTAWLHLLAVTADRPDRAWQAVTLGRGTGRDKDSCVRSTLGPVPVDVARSLLGQLVTIHRSGLASPLPLACKTSEAYAAQRRRGRRPAAARHAAGQAWQDGRFPGEQSDPEHVLLNAGEPPSLTDLLRERATAADLVAGWPADEEGDRFGVLARRVWEPLLAHETTDAA